MITVSIKEWNYVYWVDLSDQWAVVFQISIEDFERIQSWVSKLEWQDVVEVIQPQITQEQLKAERKKELISQIAKIQELSLAKRLEYTTVRDMLPEWNPIREMKLQKLSYEWDEIMLQFEDLVQELVTDHWENSLIEII